MKFSWKNDKKQYLVLAPMANITTYPFRSIVKEAGADVVFTPMISSNAILYNEEKTLRIASYKELEQPVIVQLFGYDGEIISRAADIVNKKLQPAGIDINMGCPAPKITGNESGSALLKNYPKAIEIATKVRESFSGELSVKLRLGWEKNDVITLIKKLEKIGIDAVIIHGRTAKQGYRGEADWRAIDSISHETTLPVIGNGDIVSYEVALKRLENKRLQGIMIGRTGLGNPWLFTAIKKQKQIIPTKLELIRTIKLQTERSIEFTGEKKGVLEMRKHLCWYIKGFKGAQDLRKEAVKVETSDDIRKLLKNLTAIE